MMKEERSPFLQNASVGEKEWDQIGNYQEEPALEPSAEGTSSKPKELSMEYIYAHAKQCRQEKDYMQEAFWYEQLLMYGDVRKGWLETTQYGCGVAYLDAGEKEDALYWLEKAARLGHKGAKLRCGLVLAKSQDALEQAKALYWLEQVAEDGDHKLQNLCADMNYQGKGTAVNYEKALYWYEKAAAKGNIDSMYACGMMHYKGEDRKSVV